MISIYNTDTNVIYLGKNIIIFVAVVSFPEMLAMMDSDNLHCRLKKLLVKFKP